MSTLYSAIGGSAGRGALVGLQGAWASLNNRPSNTLARANLAKNVRVGRAYSNISQEALADSADLQRSQISLIERGQGNPSSATLCKLATALDIPLPVLIDEA